MRYRSIRVLSLTGALAVASTVMAADGWSTYRNTDFGFSIEAPGEVSAQAASRPQANEAPIPLLIGSVQTEGGGALVFTVSDLRKAAKPVDVERTLEDAVQGGAQSSGAKIDSETRIVADGAPGREVAMHGERFVARSRILFKDGRLYGAAGVGRTVVGVPADYERFAASMRVAGAEPARP